MFRDSSKTAVAASGLENRTNPYSCPETSLAFTTSWVDPSARGGGRQRGRQMRADIIPSPNPTHFNKRKRAGVVSTEGLPYKMRDEAIFYASLGALCVHIRFKRDEGIPVCTPPLLPRYVSCGNTRPSLVLTNTKYPITGQSKAATSLGQGRCHVACALPISVCLTYQCAVPISVPYLSAHTPLKLHHYRPICTCSSQWESATTNLYNYAATSSLSAVLTLFSSTGSIPWNMWRRRPATRRHRCQLANPQRTTCTPAPETSHRCHDYHLYRRRCGRHHSHHH